jgi:hypothetical protein
MEVLGSTINATQENYWEFLHTHPVMQTVSNYESKGTNTWAAYLGMTTMRFLPGSRLLDMWGQATDPLPRRRAGLPSEPGDTPFFSSFGRDYTNAIRTRLPYLRESAPDQKRRPPNDVNASLFERLMKEASPLKIKTDPDWKWGRGTKFTLPGATQDGPVGPGVDNSPVKLDTLPSGGEVRANQPIAGPVGVDETPSAVRPRTDGTAGQATPMLPSRQAPKP